MTPGASRSSFMPRLAALWVRHRQLARQCFAPTSPSNRSPADLPLLLDNLVRLPTSPHRLLHSVLSGPTATASTEVHSLECLLERGGEAVRTGARFASARRADSRLACRPVNGLTTYRSCRPPRPKGCRPDLIGAWPRRPQRVLSAGDPTIATDGGSK